MKFTTSFAVLALLGSVSAKKLNKKHLPYYHTSIGKEGMDSGVADFVDDVVNPHVYA